MTKKILIAAGVIGGLSILIDGLGVIYFYEKMSQESMLLYKHALLYQMVHALALIGVVFLNRYFKPKYTRIIFYSFVFGVILTSVPMYLLTLEHFFKTKFSFLTPVIAIGGILLIIGWVSIASLGINSHLKKR